MLHFKDDEKDLLIASLEKLRTPEVCAVSDADNKKIA